MTVGEADPASQGLDWEEEPQTGIKFGIFLSPPREWSAGGW